MSWLGVCLSTAMLGMPGAPHSAPVFLPLESFTLAWTHSIEKVRWEEDYRVEVFKGQPTLTATEARIKGSAAGMEPPTGARLVNGWFTYLPSTKHLPQLRLSRSEFTADYELCDSDKCQPFSHWLGARQGYALVQPCTARADTAPNQRIKPSQAPGSSG